MIPFVTIHGIKEFDHVGGRVEIDIMLIDSRTPYPDMDKIKDLIQPGYSIKGDSIERIVRYMAIKVARYATKVYPYISGVKLKFIMESGESLEINLEEEEITDGEAK